MANLSFHSLVQLRTALPSIVARANMGERLFIECLRKPPGEPVSYAIVNPPERWNNALQKRYTVRMEMDGLPRNWRRALMRSIYPAPVPSGEVGPFALPSV